MFRVFCIFIGLYLWHTNKLNLENLIVLLLLLDELIPLMERVLWEISNFRNNLGKISDSIKILQAPIDINEADNAKNLKVKNGKIEFKNITFAYEKDKNIFDNFNLVINPGEKIGIVGKSGGGKSTLVSLLQRDYDLSIGKILIDDKDISKVKIGSLKRSIAMISQDNVLFHRTIKRNIAYGKLNANTDEIVNASKLAQADKFINETPHGYTTITGERGVKLSGGQRQRIAIARAILKDAPILILDEATSALDNKSEAIVQQAIENLMEDRTVFVIAHRLSTVRNATKIVVVNYGKIAEIGSHEELINKENGIYASLYKTQLV